MAGLKTMVGRSNALIGILNPTLSFRGSEMRKVCFLVIVLVLQACTLAPKPYLKHATLPAHDIIATDSRLRVIAEGQQMMFSTTGQVDPKRIICTEPSPDVATTLANSLGVSLSAAGYGAGSLSMQTVEGLVQLGERTAAIQLLRDKMYQTCLAYANGAISGTTYSLIMSRLDDTIVTLSLGDGAAGAFGRKLAGIGGEAAAKADAVMTGLSGEITKIEEQAGKLAAANKRADEAEKALQAHISTQPATGKEEEYKTQTTKLEKDLATAKGERDALLELMRGTAKSASDVSGKISQLQAGGGITASPAASVLREMQADFLLTDVNRDLIFACVVELGLRGTQGNESNFQKMVDHLETMFLKDPGAITGVNYAGSLLRAQHTVLEAFCVRNLQELIKAEREIFHEYRMRRAQLNAETDIARYTGETAKSRARELELFMDSIKLCNTEFKDNAERKKACLDQLIPVKPAAPAPAAGAPK